MNNQLQRGALIVFLLLAQFFTGINFAGAQETIMVKGKVLNHSELPVEGVSVGVEGSTELPVVSDANGEFSLKITSPTQWINVQPSGEYYKRRININHRSELKIYLSKTDMTSGDKEISVLSDKMYLRDLSGVGSTLKTSYLDESSALSIDQYMQGRVPGLHVLNRSGDPGSGAFTLMRGINSLHANNDPLYVIDGIPISSFGVFQSNVDGYSYNPLMATYPQDISNVTIIKDPSFTASYGSKASNGLVLISTLDPSATATVIELNLRTGYSLTPSNRIPLLNADQHKTLISQLLFSSGMREELIVDKYPNLFLTPESARYIDYQHNTNWQNSIFDEAVFSSLNLNVKGGDEIAKYGLSFGYTNAEGIIKNTSYNGYNLRFVGMVNIFQWLKLNAGLSMIYNSSNLKESAKSFQSSPIYTALSKSPMLNPYMYDENGSELIALAPVDELGISNPQSVIDRYEAKNTNLNFITTLSLEAQFNKNLVLRSNFGLSYNLLKEMVFMPFTGMELYYNKEAINVSKGANNSLNYFSNKSFLLYTKTFGDHSIKLNTGVNIQTNRYEYDWAIAKNAASNDEYRQIGDGVSNLRELGGKNRRWNWLSVYEHINYSFLDKYLFTASFSLDGSSRVGDEAINTIKIGKVPFGLFYGGSMGWRISSEPFMRQLSWLEELKLRISYGKTGNDEVGESNANNYYNTVKYRETTGLYRAVLPNSKLSYETVTQYNVGLDLSMLGGRFSTNIDLYTSFADNILIYNPIKAYFGYETRPENGAKMNNRGIDLGFFFRVLDLPAFKWDIEGSWSTVQNQINEINGTSLVTDIAGASIINKEGEQANSFYGYVFEGVYSTSEDALKANLMNDKFMPYGAGDAKFKDISGPNGSPDGIINQHDKTTLGSSLPEHFGGINNVFSVKRWSLSAFFQFVTGNEIFNFVRYKNESMSGLENQSSNVLNRWVAQGQQTNVPRASYVDPQGNSAFSSRWIEDGSFIKLKSLSLSYTIDEEFLSFRNAKFYLSATNLFTLTNYLGYDPEFGYSRLQIDQGIDYGLTPNPRQFILGVKLGF